VWLALNAPGVVLHKGQILLAISNNKLWVKVLGRFKHQWWSAALPVVYQALPDIIKLSSTCESQALERFVVKELLDKRVLCGVTDAINTELREENRFWFRRACR